MNNHIDTLFHDIPIHENSKDLFEKLLSTKEERAMIAQKLFDFYLTEHSLTTSDNHLINQEYLNAIHLLLISFAHLIVIQDDSAFNQFCRRFILESRKDSKDIFLLKKFFLSNFDSREEYHIQSILPHRDIKKRTDILLLKYVQFFHHYLQNNQ